MRRGEQPVNQTLPGAGGGIFQKSLDLLRGRRQAEQVKIGAPYERPPVCPRRRRQSLSFHGRKQKGVNRVAVPAGERRGRRAYAARRLEGPEAAFFRRDGTLRNLRQFGIVTRRRALARSLCEAFKRRPILYPAPQNFNVRVRQLLSRRHMRLLLVRDELIEATRLGVKRHDDGSMLAAGAQRLRRPQV